MLLTYLSQGICVLAVSDVPEEQVERNALAVLVLDILKFVVDEQFHQKEL